VQFGYINKFISGVGNELDSTCQMQSISLSYLELHWKPRHPKASWVSTEQFFYLSDQFPRYCQFLGRGRGGAQLSNEWLGRAQV